jgi:hypothetical protein
MNKAMQDLSNLSPEEKAQLKQDNPKMHSSMVMHEKIRQKSSSAKSASSPKTEKQFHNQVKKLAK